jgi:hypothetical protein
MSGLRAGTRLHEVGVVFSRIRDLDGVSIEMVEFGPESMQRRRWTRGSLRTR